MTAPKPPPPRPSIAAPARATDAPTPAPPKAAVDPAEHLAALTAALTTVDPHLNTKTVPPGYHIRGVSMFVDGDGNIKGKWLKTVQDADWRARMTAAILAELPDRVRPLPEIGAPKTTHKDLMCVYPLGDPHFGMYAWGAETGNDFDVNIARDQLTQTVDRLFGDTPNAEHAVIINLGDFFHSNDSKSRTAKGTPLDTDSRFPKIVRAGIEVMGEIVIRALQKHKHVSVRNNRGNHDEESSMILQVGLAERFRDNPRVTIEPFEPYQWYHRFGACLIGSTHGDRGKHKDLVDLMATDVPADWGETRHRRWYVGHVHHESTIEKRGCIVETFRTLAPGDAWHVASQYRSGRDMRCHVWDRERGLRFIHIEPLLTAQVATRTATRAP